MTRVTADWDHRSRAEQLRIQDIALRSSILHMALGNVPAVRNRLAASGIDARLFKGLEELPRLPLWMRRDVLDPARNPEGPRGVMLRGTAEGVKRFSDRSTLRKVAMARMLGGEEVQELSIEAATRPIHLHLADGPGGRIPVGYTREDLDVFARAGARLAQVVGLDRSDRLLNLVPFGPNLNFWGIFYLAHGVGITAVHARRERSDIDAAMGAFDEGGATAVALPSDDAVRFMDAAGDQGLDLSGLRLLLCVGRSLTADERASLGTALLAAGASEARIAAAYGPEEARVLWGECSVPAGRTATFGFHVYPDLEVVEIVSPETGEPLPEGTAGEVVVTPLAFKGGGVPRWRTGDLALGGITFAPCPNCGRKVPRIGPTVRKRAWTRTATLNGRPTTLDLRDAGAVAAERADDWQVELDKVGGGDRLYVHLAASDEPGPLIDLFEELRRLGAAPTQVVFGDRNQLARRYELAPGPWHRYWIRGEAPFAGLAGG